MTWFLIGLAVIAYLQIVYHYGRARRKVWHNPSKYSDATKRALLPVIGAWNDVGNPYESCFIDSHSVSGDTNYSILIAVFWIILLIPTVIAAVIYGICGLVHAVTALPQRIISTTNRDPQAAHRRPERGRNQTRERGILVSCSTRLYRVFHIPENLRGGSETQDSLEYKKERVVFPLRVYFCIFSICRDNAANLSGSRERQPSMMALAAPQTALVDSGAFL